VKRKEEIGETPLPVVDGLDAWKDVREFVRLDLLDPGTAPLRNGNNDVLGVERISLGEWCLWQSHIDVLWRVLEHDKFARHCTPDGCVEDLQVFAGIQNEAVLDSRRAVEQAFAWIPVIEAEAGRAR
jgi:hypothetical protein